MSPLGRLASVSPLPWKILIALVLSRVAEGACWMFIVPFINAQIRSLGVSPDRVGVISGAAESLYMLAEAVGAPLWGWLADRVSRKKAMSLGLMGMAVLSVGYGLCTSVWSILIVRGLMGLVAANTLISRVICAESTDPTNAAKAFSIYAVGIEIGIFCGTFIGGVCGGGGDEARWFLQAYPYLTASVAISLICCAATYVVERNIPDAVSTIDNTSPKTRVFELLRSRNVRVLLVLGLLSRLVTISWETLFSLFASTPSPSGLGLHPFTIGLILSAGGIVTIIAYLCLFPLMFGKLGYQWMLRMGFVMAVVAALGYPVMQGTVAEQRGMEGQLQGWTVMVLVPAMAAKKLSELFIVTLDTIMPWILPHPSQLAMLSALMQTTSDIGRAIGPVSLGALFGYSMHGNAVRKASVWIVYCAICVFGLAIAVKGNVLQDIGEISVRSGEDELERLLEGDESSSLRTESINVEADLRCTQSI